MKCDSQLQYNLEIEGRICKAFDNGAKSRGKFVHVTLIAIVTRDKMLQKINLCH